MHGVGPLGGSEAPEGLGVGLEHSAQLLPLPTHTLLLGTRLDSSQAVVSPGKYSRRFPAYLFVIDSPGQGTRSNNFSPLGFTRGFFLQSLFYNN